MNTRCKCGTVMRRTDIVEASLISTRRIVYVDVSPLVANWCCPSCGLTRQQRKRQPRKVSQ